MSHDLVVGVDTSDTSRRAVQYACRLAQPNSLSVLLCHVIHWSPYSFTTAEENEHRAQRKEAEIEAAMSQILVPMQQLAAEGGVEADVLVRHGIPADTLLEIVEAERPAAIIIGRTGDSSLRSRVFGTLAGHLTHDCPVPVTVVP